MYITLIAYVKIHINTHNIDEVESGTERGFDTLPDTS